MTAPGAVDDGQAADVDDDGRAAALAKAQLLSLFALAFVTEPETWPVFVQWAGLQLGYRVDVHASDRAAADRLWCQLAASMELDEAPP